MFAFIFDSVGFGEWFVLLAVILIVVGPKRMPAAARKIGQFYSKFRRAAEGFKRQLLDMDTQFTRAAEAAANEFQEGVEIPRSEPSESTPYPGHEAPTVAPNVSDTPQGA